MAHKVDTGDRAPIIQRSAHDGRAIDTEALIGQRPLVVYFYPRDDTPVCTRQACSFRDRLEAFNALDAEVIGISADDDASHRAFAEKHGLEFALVSDHDGGLSKAFDVGRALGVLGNRVTFVIDRQGIVRLRYQAQLAAGRHVDKALGTLRELA
ncbi:peroxiredoxin [Salinisphaera sp.]|uniref:peroxiredoxin n=1 Tax=Salinisphaera sp. TaxID=1914330 RepID=UPI000C3B61D7|nr:peroxiredoxin [Salinisphaera sp.]MBS61425.1 peroxiredoxin [Salinisphaera sp.]